MRAFFDMLCCTLSFTTVHMLLHVSQALNTLQSACETYGSQQRYLYSREI